MSIELYTPGNIPTYRFYISEYSSMSYEVFPLNFLESSLVSELEGDNVFYRTKFNGSLLFGTNSLVVDADGFTCNRRDDYEFFYAIERNTPCERLYFTITKEVSGDTDVYWEGYFSTSNGKWDFDECTFEVTPLANDDYADLLSKADNPITLLTLTSISTSAVGDDTTVYSRNKWVYDPAEATDGAIQYVLSQIDAGLTAHSEFFTDAINYITLTTNHVNFLMIAQKSDIIRPTSSQRAGIFEISWNELMDILWVMFQVRWNIEDDTLNVEHISWFAGGAGADLRTQLSTVATNKYVYLKEKMPKYETFKFMEAFHTDFIGQPIWYDSDCVDQNKESNTLDKSINVTTDLEYIQQTPDEIADDGFVSLCNYFSGGVYYVRTTAGAYAGDVLLNMDLSWANLHNCYYRHNRVLIDGYLNAAPVDFWSAQKNKKQECNIIQCTEFDPTLELTTELGETYLGGAKAKISSAVISPKNSIALSLIYGSVDNVNTGVADAKWIIIRQQPNGQPTTCGELHATLSEAAPAGGLDILIKYLIWDDGEGTPPPVCTDTVGVTWHIDAGITEDTYTINPLCAGGADALAAGGCISFPYPWQVTGDSSWTVGFVYGDGCKCDNWS